MTKKLKKSSEVLQEAKNMKYDLTRGYKEEERQMVHNIFFIIK
jgi:hypothetical protein